MKASLVGVAAIAACAATSLSAAHRPVQSVRTVQLIIMGQGPVDYPDPPAARQPVLMSQTEGAGEGARLPDAALPVAVGFKVHDLNRQWVQFQMANSFATLPAAPQQNAPSPIITTDHIVDVPAWMRGGMALSSAAIRFTPGCTSPSYRPTGFLAGDAEFRRAGYYRMMSEIACKYGIPAGLFDAMIIRESRYQPAVFSPKNAFGLTQLMPGTAAGLGVDRYDVADNLRGGARYLRQQLDRFGQVHLALAAYNAGPGRVRNGLVPQIAETQAYVEDIIRNWRRLSGIPGLASMEPIEAYPVTLRHMPRRASREAVLLSF